MRPFKPIEVFARIMIAWLAASLIGIYFGQAILSLFEPFIKSIILLVQADFSPTLDIVNQNGSSVMRLLPLTIRPYQLTPDMRLREGFTLDAVTTAVDHAILPLVILAMILIAWPFRHGIREISLRIAFGVLGAIIVMGVTTPLFLAARVQMNTMIFALQVGGNPKKPFLIDWMIFTESGGRWLIPIAIAILCIGLSKSLASVSTVQNGR
ncbi:hypothetical protein AAKU58_004217 [Oxalobacteraceae bacterium GrIS 1.18]